MRLVPSCLIDRQDQREYLPTAKGTLNNGDHDDKDDKDNKDGDDDEICRLNRDLGFNPCVSFSWESSKPQSCPST